MKTAIITGITGQTGSYLAEHLLEDDYLVYGVVRRSSSFNTGRIEHIYEHPNLKLIFGDLADASSISQIVGDIKPDLFFNLGAQSHVKVSFDVPEYTCDVTGMGVVRALEAVRLHSPHTRYYQASSSEIFGSSPPPQNEETIIHPRSPYGCAKAFGYYLTVNYRESYGMFCSNGVLFNHESVADFEPIIFKEGKNGHIQIKPIADVVKKHLSSTRSIDCNRLEYQEVVPDRCIYVWDQKGWTKIKFASAYPHLQESNKKPRFLIAKNAAYLTTSEHPIIMADYSEKEQQNINIGDKVNLIDYPTTEQLTDVVSAQEAELLGFIVGDGNVTGSHLRITGKNKEELEHFEKIWVQMGGYCSFRLYETELSNDPVWQCDLVGNPNWIQKYQLYDDNHKKSVPWQILNSSKTIKEEFIRGYMKADGFKAVPLNYEYKGFCTNSATLASGILYLLNEVTGQNFNINIEYSEKWRGIKRIYYRINLLSNSEAANDIKKYLLVTDMLVKKVSQRQINKDTGISRVLIRKIANGYVPSGSHHLEKPNNEIKKIIDWFHYDGWFYDIETESGTFHCGVGKGHVHNSPRRGETFVTRKITRAVGRIKCGLQNELVLGNLESKRDWGHARDYAEGIKRILETEHPSDFVLATGEAYSVRQFAEEAFGLVGLDPYKYIRQDEKYYRPAEVDYLLGDAEKAHAILDWYPKTSFKQLVAEMVVKDMFLAKQELALRDIK